MAQSARVERSSDRWISIVLSVLLHGALVAAFAYSWFVFKEERPAPTLAIEATVVDPKSVPGLGNLPPQPQPAPQAPTPPPEPPQTPPQVEPEGPPQPSPEELAKREQEQKELQEQAEQQAKAKQQEEDQKRLEQERQQEQALAQEKAAEEKRVEEKRLADEQAQRQAQEKAEAERKAREAAEAKKKAEEQKRLEAQKQVEQQAAAEREADLKRSLDQELRADQARSSGALASWQSQITARIQRAWLRPPSARQGIECVLNVTQVPGGEVTNVRIGSCNGDQAVRESIEAAVYRASPLPPPPDPTLFERNLVITFRPD
jgi:colicin import membrane protein